MAADGSCLGVCYADNHLFFSVNHPSKDNQLEHIGSIDFSFDVESAIITGDQQGFPVLKTSLESIGEKYECSTVKILSPATEECWTIVPRAVYEHSSEREAHIALLMHGFGREEIEATWHALSNADYRLLLLRKRPSMKGFNHLLGAFRDSEYVSEFEIGNDWQLHRQANGAFLMIHCTGGYISVSSYLLGKLRGCTFIRYEDPADLPYLWKMYADSLNWMEGIHDEVHIFGHHSHTVSEALSPYWDDSGTIHVMNTLDVMNVDAVEKTYGFPLESVFPAIMMSLNCSPQTDESV